MEHPKLMNFMKIDLINQTIEKTFETAAVTLRIESKFNIKQHWEWCFKWGNKESGYTGTKIIIIR